MKEIKCPNCGKTISVDDADYASILNQVKNQAFDEEVTSRLHEVEKRMALEHKNQELAKEQQYQEALGKKEAAIKEKEGEIEIMKQRENAIRQEETLKHEKSISDMKVQMEQLKAEVQQNEDHVKMVRLEEQNKSKDELHKKESEIEQLKLQAEADKNAANEREQNMQKDFDNQLKQANALVEYYKDMKIRLSTKMIGESLEQHCSTMYNTTLRSALPTAYFEKDNDAADGSKGDFIFRDFDDGMEYISIMFEMKNEMDDTEHKHKNEDFLKKLDSDRKKKNCEYAVLVSLLEADNELYNAGIVDMSHKYEKMYVIRPQFFIPMITLLMQASRKSVVYQRKLAIAEQQTIDISNFADKIEKFKDAYGKNLTKAQEKYHAAIEQIDKSIAALQKVKENLMGSENALLKASEETENLSIKKLTRGNKTMREKLEAEQCEKPSIMSKIKEIKIWYRPTFQSFMMPPSIEIKYDYQTKELLFKKISNPPSENGEVQIVELNDKEKQHVVSVLQNPTAIAKFFTVKDAGDRRLGVHWDASSIDVTLTYTNGDVQHRSISARTDCEIKQAWTF